MPGNDDLGTMGAWYVYASMGLYPMIPGVAGFSVSAPQFDKITLNLPEGQFIITGGATDKPYIQSLKFNGKKYKTPWIDWNSIKNGGALDFKSSETPNKNWGKDTISPSYK